MRLPGRAAAELNKARVLAENGDTAGALAVLERFFVPRSARLDEPDLAVFRLEAARIAANGGQPDRARQHLAAAEQIANGSAFLPEPHLAALLRRDLAQVHEQLGDLILAEHLLSAALPELLVQDAEIAAEMANARGILRLELLRLQDAVADFKRSLALLRRAAGGTTKEPTGEPAVAAFANLAMAQAEMDDPENARAAADKARIAAGNDPRLLHAADLALAQARLHALDTRGADALLEGVAAGSVADDPLRGHALLALAIARFNRGRMIDALDAAAEAVEAYRRALGDRHPAFARALHTLGTAQSELGNVVGAAASLTRASEVLRGAFGSRSLQVQATEVELGWLNIRDGNTVAARERARAALAAYADVPPPDTRSVGLATVLLGLADEVEGADADAARSYRAGQALIEQARGPFSPDLGFSLVRLGRLLTRTEHFREAAAPLDRAIAIYQVVGGAGTVRQVEALTARSELRARAGDRRGALEDARQGLALLRARVDDAETAGSAGAQAQRRGARELFFAQARLLVDLAPDDVGAVEDAFTASQASLTSRAGEALRRVAARLAAGGGERGDLLKRRDAAMEALRQADAQILAWATRGGPDIMAKAEELRDRRAEAAEQLREAGETFAAHFPTDATFLAPGAVRLATVQQSLSEHEALLAPVTGEEGMLLWVVTRDTVRAITLPTSPAELDEMVTRVRAGVDLDAVQGEVDRLPAFDAAAARTLHAALLGPAEGTALLGAVRHLILIPDGALQSLPPHLLLDDKGHWLAERYAVTIAPSIAAAVAARQMSPSGAPFAFLGVGDPLFTGVAGAPHMSASRQATSRGLPIGLRRQLAELDRLRETETEIRSIATLYGENDGLVLLRERATVRGLLEAKPQLFRTIAFSTHALMAGELRGLVEPSIVLTPEGGGDGGLLSASMIAGLDLDADLVLLSACNTAAPDGGPYAEGLSGLARAFLQAGARTLLVSHWSVASEATVKLVTRFVEADRARAGLRPAEALQEAMLALISGSNPTLRRPVFWAPFVIIGR